MGKLTRSCSSESRSRWRSASNPFALLILGFCASLMAATVQADETTGSITGVVNLEGADKVTIVDTSRGISKSVDLKEGGSFRFLNLIPGEYKVSVETSEGLKEETVSVRIGGTTSVVFGDGYLEEMRVVGSKAAPVDMSIAESGMVLTAGELNEIPVPRDLSSVTLLAPGVTLGDRSFDDYESYTSFNGASVAENAFYINGLNTTNFRNGLGFSKVPFEFYDTIQVKTGGYSAKFGRSTGGVVNATTKSGTNDFTAGVNVYYETQTGDLPDTQWEANRDQNEKTVDLFASGPIIPNRLFYYALVSRTETQLKYDDAVESKSFDDGYAANFWGAKIDGYITDDHRVSVTAFSDKRTIDSDNYDILDASDYIGLGTDDRGGVSWIATYTGDFTDNFSVSVSHGENEADRTVTGTSDMFPVVYWYEGGFQAVGDWVNFLVEVGDDKRKMNRIDFSWDLDKHLIEFGFDQEINTSNAATINSGGAYYLLDPFNEYNGCTAAECPSGANVRLRTYSNDGSFEVESTALYLQDKWYVSDTLTFELGIRNETFKNLNADGDPFIEVKNQWAPRVSAVWDPFGDGSQKVFANYGHYYLPIASNTNIRMAGGETYIHDYYDWDGDCLNDDYSPCNLGGIYQTDVFSDGEIPDTRSLVDTNIEPMYQSEIILGYQIQTDFDWSFEVKSTYRKLETAIEDVAIDAAVIDYYNSEGGWTNDTPVEEVFDGFHQYVLTNPGKDMRIFIPENDEYIDLSAERLRYPEATRKYAALEFSFTRALTDRWMIDGSYVWSHSWGNHEGYVKSDNGQDDAGITTSFDQPGLTEGSYGNLPNDRRHTIKARGTYELESGLRFGADFNWQTGRPKNCFGVHPTDEFAQQYGAESFYCDGVLVPRGTLGTMDSIWYVNANVQYPIEFDRSSLLLSLDVFNVFNNDGVTEIVETGETDGGEPDPDYGKDRRFQFPQAVRLSVRYQFD